MVIELNNGPLFGIMIDEVTDANMGQLGLVLRYTKGKENKDRLFKYVSCTGILRKAICNEILGISPNINMSKRKLYSSNLR